MNRDVVDRNTAIGHQILFKYHPTFTTSKNAAVMREEFLAGPERFNVEHLVEEVIAHYHNLSHNATAGKDFDELSADSKVLTITRTSENKVRGNISNLKAKLGALLVTLYNRITNTVDFFLIPFEQISNMWTNGSGGKKVIKVCWSKMHGYSRLEAYRRKSFADLIRQSDLKAA